MWLLSDADSPPSVAEDLSAGAQGHILAVHLEMEENPSEAAPEVPDHNMDHR